MLPGVGGEGGPFAGRAGELTAALPAPTPRALTPLCSGDTSQPLHGHGEHLALTTLNVLLASDVAFRSIGLCIRGHTGVHGVHSEETPSEKHEVTSPGMPGA